MENNLRIKQNLSIILLVFLLFLSKNDVLSADVASDSARRSLSIKEVKTKLDTLIPQLMNESLIPGLSIAVISDGKIIWNKDFGTRNTSTNEKNKINAIYEAASLSKPLFAYAVMQLVDKGKLDLDKPLISYIDEPYLEKEFLNKKIDDQRILKITARMVLSHTSGFPNWRNKNNLKLISIPGEKFGYSGEGFGLLAKVVEKITGKDLNTFMNESVLKSIGMKNSSYIYLDKFDDVLAYPHGLMQDVTEKFKPKVPHAAASLHTTSEDYAKFICSVLNEEGLSKNTLNEIFKTQVIVAPEETKKIAWGLGFGLQLTEDGTAFWHWGDNGNYKAFFIAFKNQKSGVVFFTNSCFGMSIAKDIVQNSIGGDNVIFESKMLSQYKPMNRLSVEFLRRLASSGVDSTVSWCRYISLRLSYDKAFPESFINSIGYNYLGNKKYQESIKIFILNVELFPRAFNTYDSLGEAYMMVGDIEKAIFNYKKSLELNPNNLGAVEALKKLEKNK
jgi:CubicO group peptidase (beta-lactamase class C family)